MKRSYFYMIVAALCWSGAFIAGKIGGAAVSGVEMSFYRFIIAVLCLYLYGNIKKLSFKIPPKDALIIMCIGLFGMVGYHLLFFAALRRIDVLESSAINTLNPLLSALLGYIIFKEPLNKKGVFYLFAAFFGVLTIIVKWDFSYLFSGEINRGTFLMIAGMTIWVVYSLLVRKFVKGISSVVSTFYTLTGASLFLLPFIVVMGINPFSYTANIWYVYLFMGIFSTFLGYTLQQDSILKIGVSRTNFFINFVPVFSMILGVMILGDQFRVINLISLGFISAGLVGFLKEKEKLISAGV